MKRIGLIIFLGSACGMPAGLDLERNNPVDPQADPAAQRCGNGIINSGEECDDGNRIATDSCTDSCKLAVCGDGHVRTDLGPSEADFESCDDGEANANTAGCLEGCVVARCGDGYVRDDVAPGEPGFESCDDQNAIDTDDCTNGCLLARCGDGITRTTGGAPSSFASCAEASDCAEGEQCLNAQCVNPAHEACDDGNDDSSDGCSNTCQLGRCGDGIVQDAEECDDGDDSPDPSCTGCRLARCDAGCFDAFDATRHCLRVPLRNGEHVNACLRTQGDPSALPAAVGVCRDADGDLHADRTCRQADDCGEGQWTCEERLAWHRCVSGDPERLQGVLQMCIPGETSCPGSLECSKMVAPKWHGFCQVEGVDGGSPVFGYRVTIPGTEGGEQCLPVACEGFDPAQEARPTSASAQHCPHLNGIDGRPLPGTACAAGADIPASQQGACTWSDCSDEGSVCNQYVVSGRGVAVCGGGLCGYASDDEGFPEALAPLDLTHPFGLQRFADRCMVACDLSDAQCEAEYDGLSPVAQPVCTLTDSSEGCAEGYQWVRLGRTMDGDEPPRTQAMCLRACASARDCSAGSICDAGTCLGQAAGSRQDGQPELVFCEGPSDCPSGRCLPVLEGVNGVAQVCQLTPCRTEWDCPSGQGCGGGRCRYGIRCAEDGCGDSIGCHQTGPNRAPALGSCQRVEDCEDDRYSCVGGQCVRSCASDEECDGYPCLGSVCLMDFDYGSCRVPNPLGWPQEVTDLNEAGQIDHEGFVLEAVSPRSLRFTAPQDGLFFLDANPVGMEPIECEVRLSGLNDEHSPVGLGGLYAGERCRNWYEVQEGDVLTAAVRNGEARRQLMRPVARTLLSTDFVTQQAIGASCGNGQVDPFEGCDDDREPDQTADGCEACRCTEPAWQPLQEVAGANLYYREYGYLPCHEDRREPLFESDGALTRENADYQWIYAVQYAPELAEDYELRCKVRLIDDQDEERFAYALDEHPDGTCLVAFTPAANERLSAYAYWVHEQPPNPAAVSVHFGEVCDPDRGCGAGWNCLRVADGMAYFTCQRPR